jgi:peptidyl-prolyl cis-trans isomerase D
MSAVLESTTKSKYFLMFILFMIGLGFALSTCDNIKPSNSTNVATVNGKDIGIEQFQRALQQFGLGELTEKQLKQLNFGKTIIDQLVSAELLRQWGKDLGLTPSKEEIAQEIKQLPYFLDEKKQFDITRYKSILTANRLTPQGFEDSITNEILMRHASMSAGWVPLSMAEAKLQFMLKNTGANINYVKLRPANLKSLVSVSQKEIETFVNDSKNTAILNSLYERNKAQYVAPASFKVREVSASFQNANEKESLTKTMSSFSKITSTANFSKEAEKFTKLNPEKHSSVEHGWLNQDNIVFSEEIKNQILKAKKSQIIGPEISDEQIVYYFVEEVMPEKNITFDAVKNELAGIHLKDQNSKELERLVSEYQEKIKKLLSSNNSSEIKKLAKSLNLEFQENFVLNKAEKTLAGSVVDTNQLSQIFQVKNPEAFVIKSLSDVIIVLVKNQITEEDKAILEKWNKESVEYHQGLERQLGMAQLQQVTKVLTTKAKIWKNEALF